MCLSYGDVSVLELSDLDASKHVTIFAIVNLRQEVCSFMSFGSTRSYRLLNILNGWVLFSALRVVEAGMGNYSHETQRLYSF